MEQYYRMREKRSRDRAYFRKQKIYGVMTAVFGLAVVGFGEIWSWANFCFMGDVIIMFGLYCTLTRNKLLTE